jgi:hypothetical protein
MPEELQTQNRGAQLSAGCRRDDFAAQGQKHTIHRGSQGFIHCHPRRNRNMVVKLVLLMLAVVHVVAQIVSPLASCCPLCACCQPRCAICALLAAYG